MGLGSRCCCHFAKIDTGCCHDNHLPHSPSLTVTAFNCKEIRIVRTKDGPLMSCLVFVAASLREHLRATIDYLALCFCFGAALQQLLTYISPVIGQGFFSLRKARELLLVCLVDLLLLPLVIISDDATPLFVRIGAPDGLTAPCNVAQHVLLLIRRSERTANCTFLPLTPLLH